MLDYQMCVLSTSFGRVVTAKAPLWGVFVTGGTTLMKRAGILFMLAAVAVTLYKIVEITRALDGLPNTDTGTALRTGMSIFLSSPFALIALILLVAGVLLLVLAGRFASPPK